MRSIAAALLVTVPALAACSQPTASVPSLASFGNGALSEGVPAKKSAARAYWTLFYAGADPQVEIAKLPLKPSSKVTDVDGTAGNELVCANAIRFVGDKVWIMNLSPCHGSGSSIVQVYALPLKTTSKPQNAFTLSGPMDADHMTFDASGDLWVSSYGNNAVYEYTGPFTTSGTLEPATTLTTDIDTPQGLGFDSKGNLYVANAGSSGSQAIAVFKAPIANRKPYFLKGVSGPAGLTFDASGDLFVSSNATVGAIAEYVSNDLKSGDKPTVVDKTGIAANPYGSDLSFDAAGNLYDADCGGTPGIYSYPTATKKFASNLSPSFFTDGNVTSIGCVWGIALH